MVPKVMQYLIRKLSDMVKMGIEGLAVAAVKASQKLKIYYINRALSKLNCYALYVIKVWPLSANCANNVLHICNA